MAVHVKNISHMQIYLNIKHVQKKSIFLDHIQICIKP